MSYFRRFFINTNYSIGFAAEKKAINFLIFYGYKILHHRFKCPYGEIDVIAIFEQTIIAVEIKLRKNINTAALAINEKQKIRIQQSFEYFLQQNSHYYQSHPFIRFDTILLSNNLDLIHIKNAWLCE